jgi:glycosyltransferase involved in cell wall biosynthesis
LFIKGCSFHQNIRYRVSHQREQLFANGIYSGEVDSENLKLELVKYYRIFIFARCPYTDTIGEFIKIAKEHNKTVLFEIDDLVIDKKYTDQINYIRNMPKKEKVLYNDGVDRIRKTLMLCDGAITTTERLAEEMKHFVPEVFINRNVASDFMLKLSDNITRKDQMKGNSKMIRIGYFSGSITHNDDIEMILPALSAIMQQFPNVELHFVGELDVPEELKQFKTRIFVTKNFVPWEKLLELIGSVDINIAPLVYTIFNEAKSEIKWIEAALVKVPTVATKIGAFEKMITNGENGLLCVSIEDWKNNLSRLISDKKFRERIAINAYNYVRRYVITIKTGHKISKYVRSKMKPNLFMCLPSLQISGGVLVALKHCSILRKAGVDVTILNHGPESDDVVFEGQTIFVLPYQHTNIYARLDKAVATLWTTVEFLQSYPNIGERYYLVQGYEVDFNSPGNAQRFLTSQTYCAQVPIHYITISRWCQKWLKEEYGQEAVYARNGIELKRFPVRKRSFQGRIRILVEGNSDVYDKNIDESFRIIEKLDKDKFEVWYMSYGGKPKKWYRVDKFLHKISNTIVGSIYNQCDILIKSSRLESFSYPPLEMIATGGFCVVASNDGNKEYLKNEENCLLYDLGNIESAVDAIMRICNDKTLRNKLYKNGLKTAKNRNWENLEKEIMTLYNS